MVFEVTANPANDYTVTLPIVAVYNNVDYTNYKLDYVVEWGDGAIDYFTSVYPTHTYNLNEAKRFDVKVRGTVSGLSTSNLTGIQKQAIISVKQWGQTNLKSMHNAFNGCISLQSIAADNTNAFIDVKNFSSCFAGCVSLTKDGLSPKVFASAIEATDFSYAFSGCSSLTEIPENLFSYCSKVKNFSYAFMNTGIKSIPENLFAGCFNVESFAYTFYSCTSLNSIPSNLFKNNLKVTSFEGTFSITPITSIPEKIFANCPDVLSFGASGNSVSGTFYRCTNLVEIPSNLFKYNTKVSSFGHTFDSCSNITSVPVNLFDSNIKVTDFGYVFSSCSNLEGESPYTMIGDDKYHLYERKNNIEQFATPIKNERAFARCYKLTDYENIPSDWK
jgi:hypothetical protein